MGRTENFQTDGKISDGRTVDPTGWPVGGCFVLDNDDCLVLDNDDCFVLDNDDCFVRDNDDCSLLDNDDCWFTMTTKNFERVFDQN